MESTFRRKLQDTSASGKDESPETQDVWEGRVTFRERLKHLTWAWFNFPLSTGGLALLLASTPHQFTGLMTIGKIVFIFDIVVFVAIVMGITARFVMNPGTLQKSLMHPTEALFFPTALLSGKGVAELSDAVFNANLSSVANILGCAQAYGGPSSGPWLIVALRVLFWIYVAVAFLTAVFQYLYLFTAPPTRLTIQSMTPAWILPIFPVMLTGTLASIFAPYQPPEHSMPIIIAGVTFQGLGWMVAFLMYAVYIHRLMQYGLPNPDLRPGMFITVGPPSFTGLALIGIGNALPQDYGYFADHKMAVEILDTLADFVGIFLWAIGFWHFCISLVAVLLGVRKMSFHLVWWALVFPNVGFAIATIKVGQALKSEGILWTASAMTILLVAVWIFVLVNHVRAVIKKQIMMPGKDEDKDEYRQDDKNHGIPVPSPEKHGHCV